MACGWQNSCRPWSCNYLQNAGATTYKNFLQFYAKKACKKQTYVKGKTILTLDGDVSSINAHKIIIDGKEYDFDIAYDMENTIGVNVEKINEDFVTFI